MLKVLIRSLTISLLLLLIFNPHTFAQDVESIALANEYYIQGDYEKAKTEFEKLSRDKRNLPLIHDNYLKLLTQEKEFADAEKHIEKILKEYPHNFRYELDLAVLYQNQGEKEKAETTFKELIDRITTEAVNESNTNKVRILAQSFYEKNLRPYALQTYLEGRKKLGVDDLFSLELANVYRIMNRKQLMITEYLNFSRAQPNNIGHVKNSLQRLLIEPEDLDTLEITLYDFMQQEAGNPIYNDLLIWTHLQQKNFSGALRQARALDRRLQDDGKNILNVGMIAFRNADFKTADKAFDYVLSDFPDSPNRRLAERYSLLSREEVLKSTYPVDTTAIRSLITDYENYKENSRDVFAAMDAQRRVALLQAFQLNEIDTAIATLTDLVSQPVGKHRVIAEAKMDLADIYLLDEQPWESILLYGQVERMFKDEPLGYEAKLKSAKLSYYKGEFELAQGHLDILKLATSREIANDAIDLSILIKNNTVFDSTDVAMQQYANIELLLFQNLKTEALQEIDSMMLKYANHSLNDELLYLKANTLRELGRSEEALASLNEINTTHYYEILGDDAQFLTGVIYQNDLNDTEKAMETYTELLKKFPGSIFVSEARKRLRELRGDFSN